MSKSNSFKLKTSHEIQIMKEGGKKLSVVKNALEDAVDEGVSAYEIEELACKLIKQQGGQESFKMVPNYHWATCVNVNEGIVHGIPRKDIIFKKGDIVSVDCGVFYKGFHTDTSFTKGVKVDKSRKGFIEVGRTALRKGLNAAKFGNRIYDISEAIESVLLANGLSPVKALVGHGVGRELHEGPQIYCYTFGKREDSPKIPVGAVLAIEVMYSEGSGEVGIEEDGWTISTSDDTISGLFEDTIAVTEKGSLVLTD